MWEDAAYRRSIAPGRDQYKVAGAEHFRLGHDEDADIGLAAVQRETSEHSLRGFLTGSHASPRSGSPGPRLC